MSRLDLPKVKYVNSGVEDKVLTLLFKAKAMTKAEIGKKLNVSYGTIYETISGMENSGYLVPRLDEGITYYYLTKKGCFEVEYRMNQSVFLNIYEYLIELGYNVLNIINFLEEKFYNFYLVGIWDGNSLEDQYLDWCEKNGKDPKNAVLKKEK